MSEPAPLCPVCADPRWSIVYPDELGGEPPTVDYAFSPRTRLTYRIVECETCSHRFVHPLPELQELYEENEDVTYIRSEPQRRRSARTWLRFVRHYAPEAKSLIDIGCATGFFLDEARKEMRVEGVELSRWAADLAAVRHQVHRQPVSRLRLESRFDTATMWGVIEHLVDPRHELAAVHSLLEPGGMLFVYTGDRSALIPRLLGKKWWWYQGMHIQYFSRSTLSRLLNDSGFSVVAVRNLPIYFSLASLGQSLNRYSLAKPLVRVLKSFPAAGHLVRITLSGEMVIVARRN